MALRVKVAPFPSFCDLLDHLVFPRTASSLAQTAVAVDWLAFPPYPLIYKNVAVDFFPSCLRAESKINGKGIKSLTCSPFAVRPDRVAIDPCSLSKCFSRTGFSAAFLAPSSAPAFLASSPRVPTRRCLTRPGALCLRLSKPPLLSELSAY